VVAPIKMAIATACLPALMTPAAGKATIPGARTSSGMQLPGTARYWALVLFTCKPIATDSSGAIRRDMGTGKAILAAGVFIPSRSSNLEVEQRRAQVGWRRCRLRAQPSDPALNEAFLATISGWIRTIWC
jgi:hypothetical protein